MADLAATDCEKCRHDEQNTCPIILIHVLYGDEMCWCGAKKTEDCECGEGAFVKKTLFRELVPLTERGRWSCRMFVPREVQLTPTQRALAEIRAELRR